MNQIAQLSTESLLPTLSLWLKLSLQLKLCQPRVLHTAWSEGNWTSPPLFCESQQTAAVQKDPSVYTSLRHYFTQQLQASKESSPTPKSAEFTFIRSFHSPSLHKRDQFIDWCKKDRGCCIPQLKQYSIREIRLFPQCSKNGTVLVISKGIVIQSNSVVPVGKFPVGSNKNTAKHQTSPIIYTLHYWDDWNHNKEPPDRLCNLISSRRKLQQMITHSRQKDANTDIADYTSPRVFCLFFKVVFI